MTNEIKQLGMPFFLSLTKGEKAEGLRISLIMEAHSGDYNGVLIGGLFSGTDKGDKVDKEKNFSERGNLKGVNINGMFGYIEGNLEGLNCSGCISYNKGSIKGIQLGGLVSHVGGDLNGFSAGGAISYIGKKLNGFSYGTICNHAGKNGKIAIQFGFINNITEYNENGTVIQVGFYNKAGNQSIPIINFRGLKNLKRKSLEKTIEE